MKKKKYYIKTHFSGWKEVTEETYYRFIEFLKESGCSERARKNKTLIREV